MSDNSPPDEPRPVARGAVQGPRSTTEMRAEYTGARCDTTEMVRVGFPGVTSPTQWQLLVERHTAGAWHTFAQVMTREGYLFKESAGGTYNCRQIAGTDSWSLHSYGLALDLNPSRNGPQGTSTCDQPVAFRTAVKRLHTGSGRQVFAWGGDWSAGQQDPMHWQIGATKTELATGVVDPGEEDEMQDADFEKIRDIIREEIDKEFTQRLSMNADNTNAIGRAVWQHKGKDQDKSMGTVQRGTYNAVSK